MGGSNPDNLLARVGCRVRVGVYYLGDQWLGMMKRPWSLTIVFPRCKEDCE